MRNRVEGPVDAVGLERGAARRKRRQRLFVAHPASATTAAARTRGCSSSRAATNRAV